MSPTLFAIQELCDELTYHIAYSHSPSTDLQSAALVCRTLCLAAQPQIFRHNTPPSALAVAARRLASALTHSPHLLPHIRSLGILSTVDTMQPLLTLQFPALQKISFVFGHPKSPDEGVVIPGVCREIQVDHLGSLFAACSPNLVALTIHVVLKSTPTSAPVSLGRDRRAHIKRLALSSSTQVSVWLASPASPFDFTGLVDVEIIGFLEPAMKILSPARRTIARLQTIADLSENMNMSDFRALKCLEMGCSNPWVISTLPLENSVQRLVVFIAVLAIGGGREEKAFSEIDTLVTNSPMPALREVEIRIVGSSKEFDLDSVKSLCPQLAAKYMLVVTDHRSEILHLRDIFFGSHHYT
ncbi:hypothetical protein DFH09DRAFT_1175999 [Mycena vulgaris]|nr:hypothetical protein DFH09DRAFT_1175999 [Mycena vulgaris]